VQGDVHEELVEGPVEERGVDGDDGVQAAGGEPGRRHRGVLFGDPDVPHPVGEPLGELPEPHRMQHGRRDRHDVVPFLTDPDDLVAEHRGPGRPARGRERLARQRVHHTDRVEVVLLVGERGLVTAPLLGQAVHQHRPVETFRAAQRGLHGPDVVPVDRPDVLEPQVLEHALRCEGVLEPLLRAVQRLVDRVSDDGRAQQYVLAPGEDLLVAVGRPQGREVVGEATYGRRVRAFVVVDDDDQRAVLGCGDVVQRLPRHAAGQRAVADDRDDMALLALHLAGLGEPVRPAERRGGVAVLDDVVLGLLARGIAGQAALSPQLGEVLASGQQLVYVTLVAGVPQDAVDG
jgi:hypothetical protein